MRNIPCSQNQHSKAQATQQQQQHFNRTKPQPSRITDRTHHLHNPIRRRARATLAAPPSMSHVSSNSLAHNDVERLSRPISKVKYLNCSSSSDVRCCAWILERTMMSKDSGQCSRQVGRDLGCEAPGSHCRPLRWEEVADCLITEFERQIFWV